MAETSTKAAQASPHKHLTLVIVLGVRKGQKPGAARRATTKR